MVRGVFGPLQPVPDCVRDPDVQKRSQGLPRVERHHPLPCGQASARRPAEKDGEGAHRGDEKQEATLRQERAGNLAGTRVVEVKIPASFGFGQGRLSVSKIGWHREGTRERSLTANRFRSSECRLTRGFQGVQSLSRTIAPPDFSSVQPLVRFRFGGAS